MANLVERITGELTEAETGQKIELHPFCAAFNEWGRGKVTAAELISRYNLTAAQQTQATTLANLWTSSPDKTRFMRVFKDLMYLGEINAHSRYRDINYIQTRLQEEVNEQ